MELKLSRLSDVARVEISSVDKKTNACEKSVMLCNFTDVYHNWAITKEMAGSFMKTSANDKEIEKFKEVVSDEGDDEEGEYLESLARRVSKLESLYIKKRLRKF